MYGQYTIVNLGGRDRARIIDSEILYCTHILYTNLFDRLHSQRRILCCGHTCIVYIQRIASYVSQNQKHSENTGSICTVATCMVTDMSDQFNPDYFTVISKCVKVVWFVTNMYLGVDKHGKFSIALLNKSQL
jgi:hypothetical protein